MCIEISIGYSQKQMEEACRQAQAAGRWEVLQALEKVFVEKRWTLPSESKRRDRHPASGWLTLDSTVEGVIQLIDGYGQFETSLRATQYQNSYLAQQCAELEGKCTELAQQVECLKKESLVREMERLRKEHADAVEWADELLRDLQSAIESHAREREEMDAELDRYAALIAGHDLDTEGR